jgi:uncharacterized membrane protein
MNSKMSQLKLFVSVLIIMGIIDFLWIGIIYKNQYRKVIESVQKEKFIVKMLGAVIVYIALAIIVVGWIIPRIKQELKNKSYSNLFMTCLLYGGILGGLIYAVFDFTNYAIFSKWDLKTSIIDSVWGMILFTMTTFLTLLLNN